MNFHLLADSKKVSRARRRIRTLPGGGSSHSGRPSRSGIHVNGNRAEVAVDRRQLQSNQRSWQAGPRAIEEEPHAQGLCALHGDEAHLPANMVDVIEQGQLSFVVCGVPLKARNPLFNGLAEPGTDFEALLRGASESSWQAHLFEQNVWRAGEISIAQSQVFPDAADTSEGWRSAPDYRSLQLR